MDNHERISVANALLELRYGVGNGLKMDYSAWNAFSNRVGDENASPLGINHNSSHETVAMSPKPSCSSSESSMDVDASSDVSSPTSFTKTQAASRGKRSRPAKIQKVKNTEERKKRGNLPKPCVSKMLAWLEKNRYNAYPTEVTKQDMANDMGITTRQVSNWFINARRRRLDHILAGEGKCASDFRITRKKKGCTANHRNRKTTTKVKLSYQAPAADNLCTVPPQPQTPPTSCCSSPPSSYESSTDESVFEFRPITPTPRERTLDFASL